MAQNNIIPLIGIEKPEKNTMSFIQIESRYSNNNGNPINIFIPHNYYFLIRGAGPEFFDWINNGIITGLEPAFYHPANQQVFYSKNREILEKLNKEGLMPKLEYDGGEVIGEVHYSKNEEGITIVFTPEEHETGGRNLSQHGYFTTLGFYESNGRKTRSILEDFVSRPVF